MLYFTVEFFFISFGHRILLPPSYMFVTYIDGMHYLYVSGLVDEVPEIVKSGYGSTPVCLDIGGSITDRGIEKARLEWELKG